MEGQNKKSEVNILLNFFCIDLELWIIGDTLVTSMVTSLVTKLN